MFKIVPSNIDPNGTLQLRIIKIDNKKKITLKLRL